MSILPHEITLKIFSYLDAKSLCTAAQVSHTWRELADDEAVWHRMCEQHIDKKCTKCGWGLPLLNKARKTVPMKRLKIESNEDTLHIACGSNVPKIKKIKTEPTEPVEKPPVLVAKEMIPSIIKRRPWKEVYSERLRVELNWRNNRYQQRILKGHKDGVMCIQFCDGNNIMMTGSYDKSICIWNLETGQLIRTMTGHTRCVRTLQFDEAKLVTGSLDHTLKIWNWQTGECIRTLEGHTGGVLSLHFNSKLLASGSTDHTIRVWNFLAGECCSLTGHTEWVNSVKFCKEETILVSASDDTTIRLWDIKTRECIRILNGHVGQVQVAIPSPKGFSHTLREEEEQQTIEEEKKMMENPIIISGSLDNTVKVWDMENGKCIRTLFGHIEGVWNIAYDTLRIVSCSHDSTIRVWDLTNGRCMHALHGHNGPVTSIALSDTKIISACDDGNVRIWDYGI